MRSIAMEVFGMPEVTIEGKNMIELFPPWTDIARIYSCGSGQEAQEEGQERQAWSESPSQDHAASHDWAQAYNLQRSSCHLQRPGASVLGHLVQEHVQARRIL